MSYPAYHGVDAAYLSADLLVNALREHGIAMMGPVTKLQDVSWQARERTGFDLSRFQIDWVAKRVICPQGQASVKRVPHVHSVPAANLTGATCSSAHASSTKLCRRRVPSNRRTPLSSGTDRGWH